MVKTTKQPPQPERHIQDFYAWTIYKKEKVGPKKEPFDDYLFSTEWATTSLNISNIREELKKKFPKSKYKVLESVKRNYLIGELK